MSKINTWNVIGISSIIFYNLENIRNSFTSIIFKYI